ncbi:MAG: hypothetical protein GXO19_01930 [Epsilonproteobacteria bacterium]|nr:hypothetical protein [Campylobacterota bacterium]NPA56476.1 hypothetical protein [Campylobacterota bacterium]
MDIEGLHRGCQESGRDLYSYLEQRFPDLPIEERLQIMAEILNDYLEEYEYNGEERLKREEYSIVRFRPKKK